MRTSSLAAAVLLTLSLTAQDDPSARWRIGLGLGGGSLSYDVDGPGQDDSASAGAFRIGFEGTSRRGFGGGLRLESFASDDFDSGGVEYEFGMGSMFGHFTYRLQQHRFAMPVRMGLLLNSANLSGNVGSTDYEYTSTTVGVLAEIAPEFTLVRGTKATWTAYGELGLGGGATLVELDVNGEEWESSTTLTGFELGTRVYLGVCELSLAYVGRRQSLDRTDPGDINGIRLNGYDASFDGVMFGFAVVF